MSRLHIAAGILVLWLIGLGLLARRQTGKTDSERLAEATRRLYPETYYYAVTRGDTTIGAASSAIDTAAGRLQVTSSFRGSEAQGELNGVARSSVTYLSRRFVLDSVSLAVNGGVNRKDVGGRVMQNRAKLSLFRVRHSATASPILTPKLLPVALMLSGDPKVGRSAVYWMYSPAGGKISRVTLRVAAESLFTVTDSAIHDPAIGWIPAHTDTVRAWSIVATGVNGRVASLGGEVMLEWIGVNLAEPGISVWVDAQGSIVSASKPGGVRLVRTTYEIAYRGHSKTSPASQVNGR